MKDRNRKHVIYPLPMIDRIGQLTWEMFCLRNLYDEEEYEITVFTPPLHTRPRTNRAVYNIVMRGIDVIHSADHQLLEFNIEHRDDTSLRSRILEDGSELILLPYERLADEFYWKFAAQQKKPKYHFSLSDEELGRGLQLRRAFGIPDTAPIVTLHVREAGYLPHLTYHSYRDADIATYVPAIEYLIHENFYVVRLGDNTMKPFVNPPPQLIDAPFAPGYSELVEPYFIAVSRFYIGMPSGPMSLALGLGTRVVCTNARIHRIAAGGITTGAPEDFFIPKKYYSEELGRPLRYEEIIGSPLLDCARSHLFRKARVRLLDNSPDEILLAVREMNDSLGGLGPSAAEGQKYARLVRSIELKADHLSRKNGREKVEGAEKTVYANLFLVKTRMGISYLGANPDFLGHQCVYIDKIQGLADRPPGEFMCFVRELIEKNDYDNAGWVSSVLVDWHGDAADAWLLRARVLLLVDRPAEALDALEGWMQRAGQNLEERIAVSVKGRIPHQRTRILYMLCELLGAEIRRYLEIGVHNGASMAWVLQSSHPKYCVGIDPFEELPVGDPRMQHYQKLDEIHIDKTRGNLEGSNPHGYPVELIQALSQDVVGRVGDDPVDLLLIDGDHSYDAVKRDFELYSEIVRKGGYIVLDDVDGGGPKRFAEEIDLSRFEKLWVYQDTVLVLRKH